MNEQDYTQGRKAAYRNMLRLCMKELSGEKEIDAARLLSERESAISTLRDVCERFGDNDWENNLHLSDIIEKHLWRHLEK